MILADNYIDIKDISFDVSIENCFANLQPHPKFSHCTFENYIPDDRFQSQAFIKDLLQQSLMEMRARQADKKKLFGLFGKAAPAPRPDNIYIDGTYGIGKTHLLSACYHTCIKNKAFMSFQEMNYFFHYLGVNECIQHFGNLDLLLIDEFDLNDPATTRIMAKFFAEISKRTLIVATSNTLPGEANGKFDTGSFKRELGIVADSFKTVIVEGEDYRKKQHVCDQIVCSDSFLDAFKDYTSEAKPKILVNFEVLMKTLINNHPFKYFVIPERVEAVFVEALRPFIDLNNAVRFAHFIDHCYYYNTRLFFKSAIQPRELFTKEMMETGFEKHFLRCLSRLDELGVMYDK